MRHSKITILTLALLTQGCQTGESTFDLSQLLSGDGGIVGSVAGVQAGLEPCSSKPSFSLNPSHLNLDPKFQDITVTFTASLPAAVNCAPVEYKFSFDLDVDSTLIVPLNGGETSYILYDTDEFNQIFTLRSGESLFKTIYLISNPNIQQRITGTHLAFVNIFENSHHREPWFNDHRVNLTLSLNETGSSSVGVCAEYQVNGGLPLEAAFETTDHDFIRNEVVRNFEAALRRECDNAPFEPLNQTHYLINTLYDNGDCGGPTIDQKGSKEFVFDLYCEDLLPDGKYKRIREFNPDRWASVDERIIVEPLPPASSSDTQSPPPPSGALPILPSPRPPATDDHPPIETDKDEGSGPASNDIPKPTHVPLIYTVATCNAYVQENDEAPVELNKGIAFTVVRGQQEIDDVVKACRQAFKKEWKKKKETCPDNRDLVLRGGSIVRLVDYLGNITPYSRYPSLDNSKDHFKFKCSKN